MLYVRFTIMPVTRFFVAAAARLAKALNYIVFFSIFFLFLLDFSLVINRRENSVVRGHSMHCSRRRRRRRRSRDS